MKHLHNILSAALLALLAFTAAACSSDDDPFRNPLNTPSGDAINATVSSLTFQWERDADAVQYGYQFAGPTGKVLAGGVTTATQLTFTGLQDDTEYTLEVTPFAAATSSEYSNGKTTILKGRTLKILPLDTPQLTSEVNSLRVAVSWDAVENAQYYYVRVFCEGEETAADTITSCTYRFTGETGCEYTVEVSADTDEEAYSQSEWARVEGIVTTEEAYPVWSVRGTFYDAGVYLMTNKRTMTAYSDGTYIIKDWIYTGSGCDLEFQWDSSTRTFRILNGEDVGDGWYAVEYYPGGYTTYVAIDDEDNDFDLEAGHMQIYAYDDYGSEGYMTFDWNPSDIKYIPLYTSAGSIIDADGYPSLTQSGDISVDVFKDYVYINNFMGVKGYDLKIDIDENDVDSEGYFGVSRLAYIKDGKEVSASSNGWVEAYTGVPATSYLNIYMASGYCRAWLDEDGGYLELGCYLPDGSWTYYCLEWDSPASE